MTNMCNFLVMANWKEITVCLLLSFVLETIGSKYKPYSNAHVLFSYQISVVTCVILIFNYLILFCRGHKE